MMGTRRADGTQPHELRAGEYALADEDANVVWLCSPVGRPGHVSRPTWSITVHDDATVTVDPSIWWDKSADPPGWHGYLQHGAWHEV